MDLETIRRNIKAGMVSLDECKDSQGFYSLQIENNLRWFRTSREEKERIEKYLKLIFLFSTKPDVLSIFDKQWLLDNADIDTSFVPLSILNKYNLEDL
jgi:hypothetical protein